ncbi:hypothetical protein QL093DRAFT_2595329 [Fusarium oxysporum]|nr:hypothetical protein QL093DRAFT_2595329 [Fusarium oxysporum]
MDATTFHFTEGVKSELKQQLTTPALLREEMILYELEEEAKGTTEWSVSDRGIMTTWIVARAFERLKKHQEMVEKSFLEPGSTVRPDGSQNNVIRIKGINEIDYTGWETAADIHIKSEELVDRLRDNEEIAYGQDEDLDEDTLIYTLQQVKVPQLQKMLSFNKFPTKGKKNELVERL